MAEPFWPILLKAALFAVVVVAIISLISPPSLLEAHPNWTCENAMRSREISAELRVALCAPEWWVNGQR